MSTHELARLLLAQPDVPAVITGYEEGHKDVQGVEAPRPVHFNYTDRSWSGPHSFHGGACWCDPDVDPPETLAVRIY